MSLFRVLCLWLLMLALPLQGLAAASMQYCGGKTGGMTGGMQGQGAVLLPAAEAIHHDAHAGHEHQHELAGPDLESIEAHTQAAVGHDDHVAADDSGHKCAMCAFCGHGVALNQLPKALEFGQPAYASPPEPSVLIPAIAALVPDKPPRV